MLDNELLNRTGDLFHILYYPKQNSSIEPGQLYETSKLLVTKL